MFGLSGAIISVLALATAFVLLLLIAFGSLSGATRTVTRAFWCPFRAWIVTTEFREEAWDGRPLEVNRCTAFSPPAVVTCEKFCLHLRKFPSARKIAKAA